MLVVVTARHTCHAPLCFMSKKKNHSWLLHSLTLTLSFSPSLCASPSGVITFDSRWKTGKNNSKMGEGKKIPFLLYTYTHMHTHTHWDTGTPSKTLDTFPNKSLLNMQGGALLQQASGKMTRGMLKRKQRSSVSKSPVSLHNSVAVTVESVYTSAQWLVLTLADTKSLKRHTSALKQILRTR